jgi:exonuclease SbcD
MSLKILAFADYHLGVKTHGKTDPTTGLNTREIQTLGVLDELVDYAIEHKVDVMVAAGDMYKNSMPSATLQDEFNKRIKRAADNNITVLILDGNHDVSKMETFASPLKPFATFGINNVIHTRFHKEYEYKGYNFVFLPTYHSKEDIEQIVDFTALDKPTIFIGHLTMRGAMLNDWLIEEKETYIDIETFNKKNVAAVILGHLHKHQILHREPLVFYTGSTQRIDFNEEHQPKGFVILDVNGTNVEHQFVEIESQKFATFNMEFENEKNATQIIKETLDNNHIKIKNAIVRVQVELDELTKINDKEIYDHAYSLEAANILNIKKIYNYDKRVRNQELTEHISIEKALEIHYQNKTRSAERIKLGKEIIRQVEEMGLYD